MSQRVPNIKFEAELESEIQYFTKFRSSEKWKPF